MTDYIGFAAASRDKRVLQGFGECKFPAGTSVNNLQSFNRHQQRMQTLSRNNINSEEECSLKNRLIRIGMKGFAAGNHGGRLIFIP